MEFSIGQIIKAFIFPPGVFIILILIALWLLNFNVPAAKRVLKISALSLYLLSLPIVSELLITPLEPYPALDNDAIVQSSAQAIVILSAGRFKYATEYDNKDVGGDNTFGRLRYGVKLHKVTQLPILLTGGLADDKNIPLGELMARDLWDNFEIKSKWQENKSKNTAENAEFSREMLLKENINHIFLVSDAWHMRRAVSIFEKAGFIVTPAPTRFRGFYKEAFSFKIDNILPSVTALKYSYYALHESLGTVWYKIRY